MTPDTADPTLLVLCTCPDRGTGLALARRLVEARLAACVNVIEGPTSVYRWRGNIEEDTEALLLAKTRGARYPELETTLREHHPYEVPEIIAVAVDRGLGDYLDWVAAETGASEAEKTRST